MSCGDLESYESVGVLGKKKGRSSFGNDAHLRIDVFSELQNVVRIFAAKAVRLIEDLDLHAIRLLSHMVNSKPPVTLIRGPGGCLLSAR